MIELKLSRLELELIHQILILMIKSRSMGALMIKGRTMSVLNGITVEAKELARRIHSLKSDYDTEVKTIVDPFRERFPNCKAPDWTIRCGFEHDESCGWCG